MNKLLRFFAVIVGIIQLGTAAGLPSSGGKWQGFERGMGIGGWLTNYKRFNVLPENKRLDLTVGDFEHFDSFITEDDVRKIKSWGFDHVRLGFDQIVLEEAPGKYRERTFRKIDEFIAWCDKYGLNIVLNLHKSLGNYCDIPEKIQLMDDEILQNRFIALWLEIERRYHDHPDIAFELLNDVRDVDPEKWNALADRAIRAIRAKNRERWIIVGPVAWNNPPELPSLRIWDDPKVVYTFHMYAPGEFTHQRGVLKDWALYWNQIVVYPDKNCDRIKHRPDPRPFDKAYLASEMRNAFEFKRQHPDKILWLGEFGTIRHAPKESRINYMRDVISLAKEHGIPYCVWNYLSTPNDGNRFSLVDDDTREFLSEELLKACLGE